MFVGSACIVKVLLSPSNSNKPVTESPYISPRNLLVSPNWFMSNVRLMPSRSNGFMLPAELSKPPIILPEPSCSKSMFAVLPLWSIYIRYQPRIEAIQSASQSIVLISSFIFQYPLVVPSLIVCSTAVSIAV